MFEQHFGLRENPFPAGHQLKFVYPSREHQEARAHLRYGIENREPFLLITGEVGTGKTTSLYDALNEWGDRAAVALITNSALTRQEMIEEICLRFGLELPSGVSKPAALAALEKHLVTVRARGENAVLMLDEAQNLSMELLEEIRLLSNLEFKGDKLIQIFLVGQPELESHLARHELRQLRQRITVHYRLNPLSPDETLGYIHHHINVAGGNGAVVFPSETCREIYRLTHGIPREINTLASAALIAAYADNSPSVTLAHLHAVAHEAEFKSVLSAPAPRPTEPPARPATPPAAPPAMTAPPTPPRPQPMSPPTLQPQSVIPANWPFPAAGTPQPPAPATPAAPQPPAPPVEDPTVRARGEVSRGIVEAVRRSEPAPRPVTPAPMPRPAYATPPAPPAPPASSTPAPTLPPPIPLPVQRHAPQAAAPAQPEAALPPRLRERLERELEREESGGSPVRNVLIALSVVATLSMMLILMQRFGAIDLPFLRGAAGERPQSTQTGAAGPEGSVVPPVVQDEATAALIDSLKREAELARATAEVPAPSQAPAPTRPAAAQPRDAFQANPSTPVPNEPAPTPSAPAPAPAVETGSFFGVQVSQFGDAARANAEKDRVARTTGVPTRVIPMTEAGVTLYRVVVGPWSSAADADQAMNALLENGSINSGRVVTIPKR